MREQGRLDEAEQELGTLVADLRKGWGPLLQYTLEAEAVAARLRHAQPDGAAAGAAELRAVVERMGEFLGAAHHDTRKWRATKLPDAVLAVSKKMAASRYASPTSLTVIKPDVPPAMRRSIVPRRTSIQPPLQQKKVRFAAPSPLEMFPVTRDTTITDVWAPRAVEKKASQSTRTEPTGNWRPKRRRSQGSM